MAHPETGRRKQKWHSGFKTRREAERGLAEILGRLDKGTYILPSNATVADFLRDWLPAIQSRVRASTWESYKRNVELHIIPRIGGIQLQILSAATLNRLSAIC